MSFLQFNMRKILVFTLAIALSGCAAAKPDSRHLDAQQSTAEVTVYAHGREVSDIHQLSPGMQIVCSDPATGRDFKAQVQSNYFSALGVECSKINIQRQYSQYLPASLCAMDRGWHIFYPAQDVMVRNAVQ